MRLTVFKILSAILMSNSMFAQEKIVCGHIYDKENKNAIYNVEIYEKKRYITKTNKDGYFYLKTNKNKIELSLFYPNYNYITKSIKTQNDSTHVIFELSKISVSIDKIEITPNVENKFKIQILNDVEETSIFAGKKSEVILLDESISNKASNNARQIYSQIGGLNIYENDDAGLQLNIGGRGLDPNRTANFNVRQNGYDISADVLGYPESYYTPPSESLSKIEIVRGAASLQYGTQFGGLINFIIKKPNRTSKKLSLKTRNTTGSYNLFTNFTSIKGSIKKFEYYSFFNYKKGNGFRDNSNFNSKNIYSYFGYQLNQKLKLSIELTYLDYIAKQAGGLTDYMFIQNPLQSNRERNWFQVNWFLYHSKLIYNISKKSKLSLNFFGLNANRYALGFRSNRVDQIDPLTARDLIKGEFVNSGIEKKWIIRYNFLAKQCVSLFGSKIYRSNNTSIQGPGSDRDDADFSFYREDFPYYNNQSEYRYPNFNLALFSETIFYVNKKLSITPGIRFENISTKSNGSFNQINLDAAGNPIWDTIIYNNNINERSFMLAGIGLSYRKNDKQEMYLNFSQNYRSVTFADISIINPAYSVNPNISDESGYTFDIGIRGDQQNLFSYNLNAFSLFYNNRIGFIQKEMDDGNVKSERGNIGDALIYGIESLINMQILSSEYNKSYQINSFINSAIINSHYTKSDQNGIEGNDVEFVPKYNIKSGIIFRYNSLTLRFQHTYVSKQFTDASNAIISNLSGVIGEIPEYNISDLSASFKIKRYTLETGINNLFNKSYFTRRATGYPGPGIIPSSPRNYYITIEIGV